VVALSLSLLAEEASLISDEFVVSVPPALQGVEPVDVALILGSGLSGLADHVVPERTVPFAEIEGFPLAARNVSGHAGRLVIGALGGKRVAVFQGRIHCYQGFSATEVAFPVRLAHALGASCLIATNAAGGVNEAFGVGDLVLISDHLNLSCDNPLVGWAGPQGGNPFVPLRDAYDPELRAVAIEAARETGVALVPDGVYAWLLGPSYETPAEVRMLRTLGADVVGMSTVPEVIAARALGLRVLGMSLVTNAAAGAGLSHEEVLEAGRIAAEGMQRLALAILQRL
jgi:purine-nucleoside phosphorylase